MARGLAKGRYGAPEPVQGEGIKSENRNSGILDLFPDGGLVFGQSNKVGTCPHNRFKVDVAEPGHTRQ
jgi:hypothetical protein